MANPGRIVTAGIGLTMALAIGSVGCSNAEESVKVLADELAEQGVAAWAEGRWTCEGQIGDGELRDVSAVVAIGGDGRFSWERVGETPVQSGTWAIEGLEVRLEIPWSSDGYRGFYEWTHRADAERPTHLDGHRMDSDDIQDLDVDIDVAKRRVHLVQVDDGIDGGTNYDWDVTCTRESSDPGTIAPTIPPAVLDD